MPLQAEMWKEKTMNMTANMNNSMDNNNIGIVPSDWTPDNSMIKVIGVGGGGCNAVTYMFNKKIKGCSFVVCNTDSQALQRSTVPVKIQMGHGRGAGTDPTKGRNAALESQDEIAAQVLDNGTEMLFITAGMGGGTGTGAAPVIAKMARDKGILTVAVVTVPFDNEGNDSLSKAIDGIHELEKNVDSLLIIKNEKLYDYFGDLLVQDAFPKSDEVLATAVQGITEIISRPGYINVDFEDIKTMMRNSGIALMGCGTGSGPNRIEDAVKQAFESPLLNDYDLKTAKNVLINITVGNNKDGVTMDQLSEINNRIKEYTGGVNNFKRGLVWDDDPEFGDTIRITAIVTGLRFTDIMGPGEDIGNYIIIDENFVFGQQISRDEEGITLPESSGQRTKIGFNTKENCRIFNFADDEKPILIIKSGEDKSRFENEPAIRRVTATEKKK